MIFPWRRWLFFAARELNLPPTEFWRLSFVEWRALAFPEGMAGPTKSELEALMERFPDA